MKNQDIILYALFALAMLGGALLALFFKWLLSRRTEQDKQRELHELEQKYLNNAQTLAQKEASLEIYERQISELKQEESLLRQRLGEADKDRVSFMTEKKILLEKMQEQAQEREVLEQRMEEKFQLLANKIFEDKTSSFKKESKESLEGVLNPLRENIAAFKKEVADKYSKENENRIRLEEEIKRLASLSQSLSKDANDLSSALSGSVKAQGNWGEIILERVLKYSGLVEGEDFIREGRGLGLKDENRSRQKPDVIINLPREQHLIIDSKVTLNSYTRYISTDDSQERERELQKFIQGIKDHINHLSGKSYEFLEKLITPEYVMMFTPIEGALSVALEKDPSLFEYGWERRVILTGPTNLLATLKAVESVWRQDKQEKNAVKIAEQGGRLYDKFVGFIDDMNLLKERLKQADDSYQKAFNKLYTGRGNIISQAQKMKDLGAKAKKSLDSSLVEKGDA